MIEINLPIIWAFILGEIHKVSSITTREFLQIVASWNYHTNKKQFNCFEQIEKMNNQPNSEARIEGFKNRNGCENRKSDKPRQTYKGFNFHNCYCNHLDDSFNYYLMIQDNYSKGFLPFSGGSLEQPNKVMEIINLVSVLKFETEKKELEQQQKQLKGK